MGEKLLRTTIVFITLFGLILGVVLSPAYHLYPGSDQQYRSSLYVWEDTFNDTSKIDANLSYGIVVANGTASMQNTFPVWTNPSFTRMKPITVTNTGNSSFEQYVLNLTITYDPDMQVDFDDLRFVSAAGSNLDYWIKQKTNGVSATVWVEIPTVPAQQTSMVYMFYGNPAAITLSNFNTVFTWVERTSPDVMVSFKAAVEGAWDPDVAYGNGRFLVAWEERLGPEDINVPLPDWERMYYSPIYGRTYNTSGGDPFPIPSDDLDINISLPGVIDYHAENAAIAFGAGKFFVVWEENVIDTAQPWLRYEADIKGALVSVAGEVLSRFPICTVAGGQFDPHVDFDSTSNRFLVVWEDARNGGSDYDVRGRLYNSNGFPIAVDFPIAFDTNYQGEPWVCSDNLGYYLVVYEHGVDPAIGPFSLSAKRLDSNGGIVGTTISIATGSSTVDNIFPAVSYNPLTQRFMITWNDADISVNPNIRDSYDGNIWARILSRTGYTVVSNFIVEPGTSYIRTDSVPYFGSLFFVTYDGIVSGTQDIFGRMVSADGMVLTTRKELSDGSSLNVDWNNLALGDGHIFVTWEDERDLVSAYADAFGYVWECMQTTASPTVSSVFGVEYSLILQSRIVSYPIAPEEWYAWDRFYSVFSAPTGTTLLFDVLDQTGTTVLLSGVSSGANISSITQEIVRLRASFYRPNPSATPNLDSWNISAIVGTDVFPPQTTIALDPSSPNGENGWYVTAVSFTLTAVDPDSPPENITTFYRINDLPVEIYDPLSPPVIDIEGADNRVEYWSTDSINEESHHVVTGINIDVSAPAVSLYEPPYYVSPGTVLINGSVTEYASGSGVDQVLLWLNDELMVNMTSTGEQQVWFEWSFTADAGETFDVYAEGFDVAGLRGQDRRTVVCTNRGVYEIGYLYLFDNPPDGPKPLLVSLGVAAAINYDTLFIVASEPPGEAAWVEFVAQRIILKDKVTMVDQNLSDGCSIELTAPPGIYSIKAYVYDSDDQLLEEQTLISKIVLLLL